MLCVMVLFTCAVGDTFLHLSVYTYATIHTLRLHFTASDYSDGGTTNEGLMNMCACVCVHEWVCV